MYYTLHINESSLFCLSANTGDYPSLPPCQEAVGSRWGMHKGHVVRGDTCRVSRGLRYHL